MLAAEGLPVPVGEGEEVPVAGEEPLGLGAVQLRAGLIRVSWPLASAIWEALQVGAAPVMHEAAAPEPSAAKAVWDQWQRQFLMAGVLIKVLITPTLTVLLAKTWVRLVNCSGVRVEQTVSVLKEPKTHWVHELLANWALTAATATEAMTRDLICMLVVKCGVGGCG